MSLSVKNMLGGSGGGASPYAWAKYEATSFPPVEVTNPSFSIECGNYNHTISNASFDFTQIDDVNTFLDGFSQNGTNYYFENNNGTLNFYPTKGSTAYPVLTFTVTSSTSATFGTNSPISASLRTIKYDGIKTIKEAEIIVDSFLEYITDKNPLKYPDGEVADDGFFYRYANEGLYIWEKSGWSNEHRINILRTGEAQNVYYPNFDNCQMFDSNGNYVGKSTVTVYTDIIKDYYYLHSSGICYLVTNNDGTTIGTIKYLAPTSSLVYYEVIEPHATDFIGYAVSDKEDAYPSDGEMDGYYYKKTSIGLVPEMFGCSKIAVDKFVPTTNANMSGVSISHSLGEIPKAVIIADTTSWEDYYASRSRYTIKLAFIPNFAGITSPNSGASSIAWFYYSSGSKVDYTYATGYWEMTSSTVKGVSSSTGFNTSAGYMSNHEYTVITMA